MIYLQIDLGNINCQIIKLKIVTKMDPTPKSYV